MNTTPWVEKHRPSSLCDIKGHVDIIKTLSMYGGIENTPHLLLYGPPGTGKTSTIMALSRETYGKNVKTMVLEMNASDDRGVGVVRTMIQSFVETKGIVLDGNHSIKLIILDEADAMTVDAQIALRRIIEKNTLSVRFCICCNFVNKIIPALQSRCTKFRFSGVAVKDIRDKIVDVISKESVNIDNDAVDAIVSMSNGDTRKAINILQSVTMSMGKYFTINRNSIYSWLGIPCPEDVVRIINVLLTCTFLEGHVLISTIIRENGNSLLDIICSISKVLLDHIICEERLSRIMGELSEIEYRISQGGSDFLNIGSLISVFKN